MTPWVASCVCATASLSGWVCLGLIWSSGHPIICAGGAWAEGKCKLIPSCVPCHLAWFMEISGKSRLEGFFLPLFHLAVWLLWLGSGIFPGLVRDPLLKIVIILGGDWESWVGGRSAVACQGGSFLASFAIRTLVGVGRDLISPAGQGGKGGVAWQMDFCGFSQIFGSQFVILLPVNHGSM